MFHSVCRTYFHNKIEPKGAHRTMMKNEMRSPDYNQKSGRSHTGSAVAAKDIPAGRKKKIEIMGQFTLFNTGAEGVVVIQPVTNTKPKADPVPRVACLSDREDLIESNMGLVYATLKKIKGVNANNRGDVLQAGMLGLVNAARGFDPSRGFRFSSYAVPSIENAMVREVRHSYGKLDTVSMEELTDERNRALSQIVEPETAAPTCLQEKDEIVEMLFEIANTQRRAKERKGVLALAMQMQGFDSAYIAAQTNVKKSSYNAMVSAGRRALRNHPQLVNYMSMLKDEVVKDIAANLLGSPFPVCYARNAVFDVPTDGATAREYLEVLVEVIEREDVSDLLLHEVVIGETAYLIDVDNGCTNTLEMGLDAIEVRGIKKVNWKPLRRSA